MELTLKRLLEQAEFTLMKGRGRGYDQAEVDDFLDRASAMAAKVEVQLTQALEEAAAAKQGTVTPDLDAEVERRVAERIATAPTGPSEEETAEEVRRTIVLAQRTADAAIREAREDAEKLLGDAQERSTTMVADAEARSSEMLTDAEARATTLVSDAEARAADLSAEADSQVARERREARQRLAAEIGELEGLREALRTDVTVLERHVEEQRTQLASTLGELQRLLEDPAGFRLAPVPVLLDPEIPDLTPEPEPEPEPEPVAVAEPHPVLDLDDTAGSPADELHQDAQPEPEPGPEPEATTEEPGDAEVASSEAGGPEISVVDVVVTPEPGEQGEPMGAGSAPERLSAAFGGAGAATDGPRTTVVQPLAFDEVDHEAPGEVPDLVIDPGPPTAPISTVDLDREAADVPRLVEPAPVQDDDAFLAELRKAMADDEPLGPRDHDDDHAHADLFDEDRKGWRFGRRR